MQALGDCTDVSFDPIDLHPATLGMLRAFASATGEKPHADASATARERDRVEADVALNVHDVEAVEARAISDDCGQRLLLLRHE